MSATSTTNKFDANIAQDYKNKIANNIKDMNKSVSAITGHQLHHQNLIRYKYYYKILLIISVSLIMLGFIFVLVLYFLNDDRSKGFDGLTYASLGILLVPAIIISIFIIVYNNYEYANNFSNKSANLIKYLKDEINKLINISKDQARKYENDIEKLTAETNDLKNQKKQILAVIKQQKEGNTWLSQKEGESGLLDTSPLQDNEATRYDLNDDYQRYAMHMNREYDYR